jgi:hypothetical protein
MEQRRHARALLGFSTHAGHRSDIATLGNYHLPVDYCSGSGMLPTRGAAGERDAPLFLARQLAKECTSLDLRICLQPRITLLWLQRNKSSRNRLKLADGNEVVDLSRTSHDNFEH